VRGPPEKPERTLPERPEALIDKSLQRGEQGVVGEPRSSTLETIREDAAERLAASGEDGPRPPRVLLLALTALERAASRPCGGARAGSGQGGSVPVVLISRFFALRTFPVLAHR
jgi:hypothetical protein